MTLNADGSFHYQPEADSSGEDSFTYRLSDGTVDFNLAKVTLTVRPVTEATVATGLALETGEMPGG